MTVIVCETSSSKKSKAGFAGFRVRENKPLADSWTLWRQLCIRRSCCQCSNLRYCWNQQQHQNREEGYRQINRWPLHGVRTILPPCFKSIDKPSSILNIVPQLQTTDPSFFTANPPGSMKVRLQTTKLLVPPRGSTIEKSIGLRHFSRTSVLHNYCVDASIFWLTKLSSTKITSI